MQLLPLINNVSSSLIIQEEHQRFVGILDLPADPVTFITIENSKKNSSSTNRYRKKENSNQRPIYSHCGIRGHVIDHCYKLHGYPPSYKLQLWDGILVPVPANFFVKFRRKWDEDPHISTMV